MKLLKILKMYMFKKILLSTLVAIGFASNVFALTDVYVQEKNIDIKPVDYKFTYNNVSALEFLTTRFYCGAIYLFGRTICYEHPTSTPALVAISPKVENNTYLGTSTGAAGSVTPSYNLPSTSAPQQIVYTSPQRTIYQVIEKVIERAVPGPKGDEGDKGDSGLAGSAGSAVSAGSGNYYSSYVAGAQYNGSTNPNSSFTTINTNTINSNAANSDNITTHNLTATGTTNLATTTINGSLTLNPVNQGSATSSILVYGPNGEVQQITAGEMLASNTSNVIAYGNDASNTITSTVNGVVSTTTIGSLNNVNLTGTTTSANIVNSGNFLTNFLSAVTGYISNLVFDNATGTNITATGTANLATVNSTTINTQTLNASTTNSSTTNTDVLNAASGTLGSISSSASGTSIVGTTTISGPLYATNTTLGGDTTISGGTTTVSGVLDLTNASVTGLSLESATITNLVFTNATGTNLTLENASITNATVSNLFADILNAFSAFFTNLTATNATVTNLVSTNSNTGSTTATSLTVTGSSTLASTTINGTLSLNPVASGSATSSLLVYGPNGEVQQITAGEMLASNTTNVINYTGDASNTLESTVNGVLSTTSIDTLNNINLTGTTTAATITAQQVDTTGLTAVNATLTNATTSNLFATNASITNATTSNFFADILSAITGYISNLIFDNATGTNLTATGTASLATIVATTTNTQVLNASTTNTIDLSATNATITNLVTDTATFGPGTTTITGPLSLSSTTLNSMADNGLSAGADGKIEWGGALHQNTLIDGILNTFSVDFLNTRKFNVIDTTSLNLSSLFSAYLTGHDVTVGVRDGSATGSLNLLTPNVYNGISSVGDIPVLQDLNGKVEFQSPASILASSTTHTIGYATATGVLTSTVNGVPATTTLLGMLCENTLLGTFSFCNGGNTSGANAVLGTNDNFNLGFETNNVEKMTLFSLANPSIGIGRTSLTGVNGGASSYSGPTLFTGAAGNFSGSTGWDFIMDDDNNATNNQIRFRANGDGAAGTIDIMTIEENLGGRVGIGTTAPGNALHIASSTGAISGLRLAINSGTSVGLATTSKVLTVDANGDVRLSVVPGTENIVEFSVNANPNTAGTTFSPNQQNDPDVIYTSTIDNSTWKWNGSTYVTYTPTPTLCSTTSKFFCQNGNSFAATGVLGVNDANDLIIKAQNTEAIRLFGNGKVAIGNITPSTTTAQRGVLTVKAGTTGPAILVKGYNSGTYPQIELDAIDQYQSNHGLNWTVNGTPYFNITKLSGTLGALNFNSSSTAPFAFTGANVGVGTTTPGNALHVASSTGAVSGLRLGINASSATTTYNNKQLTVDANGDVVLVDDAVAANKAWSTLGNLGTVPATNFLGTIDNQALVFRTNNLEKLRITTGGRLDFSNTLGGGNNVFIEGGNEGVTGNGNTSVGGSLFSLTSGSQNSAFGLQALSNNTTGSQNTAIGYLTQQTNVAGSGGVAVGAYSQRYLNPTATAWINSNVSMGNEALRGDAITPASNNFNRNVAIGDRALIGISTGNDNVAMGYFAGKDITAGSGNVFLGASTGYGITTGTNNTILGANVSGLAAALSNNIIIADGAGNRRINVIANGNTGIGTITPGNQLEVASSTGAVSGLRLAINSATAAATGTGKFLAVDANGDVYQSNLMNLPSLAVGTSTLAAGKVATFAGDIDVTGTIDPTRILFSGLNNSGALSPTYTPSSNNNSYRIEFAEGGNLNFKSDTTNDILNLMNDGKVGIGTSTPVSMLHVLKNAATGTLVTVQNDTIDPSSYAEFYAVNGPVQTSFGSYASGSTAYVGTQSNSDLRLMTNRIYRISILANGNVGVGTTTPIAKFQVHSSSTDFATGTYGMVNQLSANTAFGSRFAFYKSRGSATAPTAIINNDVIGSMQNFGYDGTAFVNAGAVNWDATEAWTPSAHGTRIRFTTVSNGSTTLSERMRIDQNGNVGIGTAAPGNQLHIASSSGSTSGLRLGINSSTATTTSSGKVLGINASGDVILVEDAAANGNINCTNSTTVFCQNGNSFGAVGVFGHQR
jgi:hypothetical protein